MLLKFIFFENVYSFWCIAEIREYSTPPEEIERVVRSVLLLLGDPMRNLKNWNDLKLKFGMIGKTAIKKRMWEVGCCVLVTR